MRSTQGTSFQALVLLLPLLLVLSLLLSLLLLAFAVVGSHRLLPLTAHQVQLLRPHTLPARPLTHAALRYHRSLSPKFSPKLAGHHVSDLNLQRVDLVVG